MWGFTGGFHKPTSNYLPGNREVKVPFGVHQVEIKSEDMEWGNTTEEPVEETLEEMANQAEHLPKNIPNKYALLIDMPEEIGEILKSIGYNTRDEEGYNVPNAVRDVSAPESGLLVMSQTGENMATAEWASGLTSITAPVTIFYGKDADMKTANSIGAYAVRDKADFEKLVKRLTPEEAEAEKPLLETNDKEVEDVPSIQYARPQVARGRVTTQLRVVRDRSALNGIAASVQHYQGK